MQTLFSELTSFAREAGEAEITGEVRAITGITLTAVGLERVLGIGERCIVHGSDGPVHAEVVGLGTHGTELLPFGSWRGVAAGDRVEVAVGDGKGHLPEGNQPRPLRAAPPGAFDRKRIGPKLATHVRALDVFTPLCQGQRLGIFAGSGVGKSTLMAMLARYTDCDVVVMALVGERGREVQDFISTDLGPEGMEKAVLVVATGDEPPLTRRQAAWTAMAVAEHFRDQGQHVLLLMDSVTRFAMAQREIGLASREPPTAKGYPPTVFSELPQMLERAGPGPVGKGDITAIFTVLVDGDDMNDPIADAVRGITDGHIVLDRKIAEKGRYPAIDLLASVSRTLPDCHSDVEYTLLTAAHKALAAHADMEELIRIGAYRSGSNPELDRAIAFAGPCETFLSQRKAEHTPPQSSFAEVAGMLDRAGISPG